jgi:hypothetical protein
MAARSAGALAVALLTCLYAASASAEDDIKVTSCLTEATPPLPFEVDCSNVKDPAAKQLCQPFAVNQACKVFPAYRQITGINLEKTCRSLKYSIYDRQTWPYQGEDAGGMSLGCAIAYLSEYAINLRFLPKIGPYDTHEILHEYQTDLGALPYAHILFTASQAEAMHLIGDNEAYGRAVARMRQETGTFEARFKGFTPTPLVADKCVLAEILIEETLYLQDPKSVYAFYRKLVRSRVADQADREARFNRMFDTVSNGQSKQFLLDHGCAPF